MDRKESVLEDDSLYLIRRSLEFFAMQKIGMTSLKIGRLLDDCCRDQGMTSLKDWFGGGNSEKICNYSLSVYIFILNFCYFLYRGKRFTVGLFV